VLKRYDRLALVREIDGNVSIFWLLCNIGVAEDLELYCAGFTVAFSSTLSLEFQVSQNSGGLVGFD